MKKYYLITLFAWLILAIFSLIFAVWQTLSTGMHHSWWYYVAVLVAFLMVGSRFVRWKKSAKENLDNKREK